MQAGQLDPHYLARLKEQFPASDHHAMYLTMKLPAGGKAILYQYYTFGFTDITIIQNLK
jgi:hypothetical protein